MIKAKLFKTLKTRQVQCLLCSHYCLIPPGETGKCKVRKNINGVLYSLNSDHIAAMQMDPIEKKPLYHYLPGSQSLSIAASGCNFKCSFCQNHSLSQVNNQSDVSGRSISPGQIIQQAKLSGAKSISYTYTEPTVYYELMIETARLAKGEGLKNIMVTNGFFSAEALKGFSPYIDGANIDLKSFSNRFYKKYCQAELPPVLDSIRRTKEAGIWLELTTLLITDLNISDRFNILDFILKLDPSIPWHVSRFYPQFEEIHRQATDEDLIVNTLQKASDRGLKYVYAGNIRSRKGSDTVCPECQNLLIERTGYHTQLTGLENGRCSSCNFEVEGIWD